MTDTLLTAMHVMYRIRKVLQRSGMVYQRSLFMKIGLPEGLTEDEFGVCVGLLEKHGWLTVDKGDRGRPILTANKEGVVPVPVTLKDAEARIVAQ